MPCNFKLNQVLSAVETIACHAGHEGLVCDAVNLGEELDKLCDELGTDDVEVRHAVLANDTLMTLIPRVYALLSEFCNSEEYDAGIEECRGAERTFQLVRELLQKNAHEPEHETHSDNKSLDNKSLHSKSLDNKSRDNKSMPEVAAEPIDSSTTKDAS
jgi:hypothetical protein